MKSWGVAITLLGSVTVLLLGFIVTQLLQKPEAQPAPAARSETPVAPPAVANRLEIQRIELERERLAVEALRLKAQIQSDLAQFELALRAPSADAAEEVTDAGEPATEELADAEPPSMQKFEPDPIAFEEFREPLEPFGEWTESADYGAVWSPDLRYVDDGWAPYTNGSWGYSDYGWSFASSEPFGWACYHYGRWIRLGHRWCWVPGRDWAPAWVSWRICDSHIAWAPLPPCARWNRSLGIGSWVDAYCGIGPTSYCFVERANFGAPDCRPVLVDRKHNVALIRRSKNVTHLSRSDRFVHNHGPDFDRACELSSRPIQRLEIDPAKTEGKRKVIVAERGGAVKKRAPLKKLARTKPDRGWAGLAKKKGDLLPLRKQMLAEARSALDGRTKIKPDVIARAKKEIPRAVPVTAKTRANRNVIAKAEAKPNTPSPAKRPQVGKQAPAPTKAARTVNKRPEAVAAVVKTPKAATRTIVPKPTTSPAGERQKSDAAAAATRSRARIAQAKQAEERAAAAAHAEEQEVQRKRDQAEAAMIARRKAEAAEQAARERQKVREEHERVTAANAKRDRDRKKMIADNEARAEQARKAAEARREAIARQERAAAEERARRKAEDDARRRRDDQRRKVAAQEQEDRRRKMEANRKRQEKEARDRQAAEQRRDAERRKARAMEDQRRKAAEDSRRKQAADAARAKEAQRQRAQEAQRRKAAEDARRQQAADAARAREAQKQRERQKQQADEARQKQRSSGGSKSRGR